MLLSPQYPSRLSQTRTNPVIFLRPFARKLIHSGAKWRITNCILKFNTRQVSFISFEERILVKKQFPVTAHVPNFDFLTGCRELKGCEEGKRTLKNPFASRLDQFDTTLKLLKIIDQGYIVPVEFRFGRNRDFLALFSFPSIRGQKEGWRFNASWRLISPSSFHTSSDNRDRNMQKWNSNNRGYVRKKPLRHGSDWGDPRTSWLREAHCSLQRRVLVNCLLNPLTADKI